MYTVVFTKQAEKDKKLLKQAGLEAKAKSLLNIIAENPFQTPPPYEKLVGDLHGYCSRRLNRQHRIVYAVFEAERVVRIHRMWTHYE